MGADFFLCAWTNTDTQTDRQVRVNLRKLQNNHRYSQFGDVATKQVVLSKRDFPFWAATQRVVVIHLYSKTNQMHKCFKFILFGVTPYMFRTVYPSIIRSSRLYIQQLNRYCYLLASKQTEVSV